MLGFKIVVYDKTYVVGAKDEAEAIERLTYYLGDSQDEIEAAGGMTIEPYEGKIEGTIDGITDTSTIRQLAGG